jgi:hypothetical protein
MEAFDGIKSGHSARASSDQMESSDRIKMLDSKVLEQFYPSVWMDIALGAKRSAMWCTGQASQQRRWADLVHEIRMIFGCPTKNHKPDRMQSDRSTLWVLLNPC